MARAAPAAVAAAVQVQRRSARPASQPGRRAGPGANMKLASLSDTVTAHCPTVTVTVTVKPPFTFTVASEFEFESLARQAGSRPS